MPACRTRLCMKGWDNTSRQPLRWNGELVDVGLTDHFLENATTEAPGVLMSYD
jgi:hypothetical protein